MKGKILSPSEKRELLKKELQKAKKKSDEINLNIDDMQTQLDELMKKLENTEKEQKKYIFNIVLLLDILIIALTTIISLISVPSLAFALNPTAAVTAFYEIIMITVWLGVLGGTTLATNKSRFKFLVNIYNKVIKHFMLKEKYKNLVIKQEKQRGEITTLEREISNKKQILENLNNAIKTLNYRLYGTNAYQYKAGKAVTREKTSTMQKKSSAKTKTLVKH